jgi:hypothetical protein
VRLRQSKSLILALASLALLLVAIACEDDKGEFSDDRRGEGQQSNSGPNPDSENRLDSGGDNQKSDASFIDSFEPEDGKLPGRDHGDRTHGIWPQVWSQHAPSVQSWEYKVNCGEASSHTDPCFLSDLTSVRVTTPSGELIELEKDFNTNEFSGEITRRWVLYGPQNGNLPEKGEYVFSYSRGDELVYEQAISYDSGVISYPTGVEWKRSADDIVVTWDPPPEASEDMHYKALIWQVDDTPELFVSNVFEWDADTAVLENPPMIVGGKYSLNVAIYFNDGYAYSDYVIFEWPEPGT